MSELKTYSKSDKDILKEVRALSDMDLWKVVGIFDTCQECWDSHPEGCGYRVVRKKIGLGECENFELRKSIEKDKKRFKAQLNTSNDG